MFRQGLVCLLVLLLVSGLGAGEGNVTFQGGDRSRRSDREHGQQGLVLRCICSSYGIIMVLDI